MENSEIKKLCEWADAQIAILLKGAKFDVFLKIYSLFHMLLQGCLLNIQKIFKKNVDFSLLYFISMSMLILIQTFFNFWRWVCKT